MLCQAKKICLQILSLLLEAGRITFKGGQKFLKALLLKSIDVYFHYLKSFNKPSLLNPRRRVRNDDDNFAVEF